VNDFNANINPSHYKKGRVESLQSISDIMCNMTCRADHSFAIGNALKYLSRFCFKGDPIGDLKKAKFYIQWVIDEMEKDN